MLPGVYDVSGKLIDALCEAYVVEHESFLRTHVATEPLFGILDDFRKGVCPEHTARARHRQMMEDIEEEIGLTPVSWKDLVNEQWDFENDDMAACGCNCMVFTDYPCCLVEHFQGIWECLLDVALRAAEDPGGFLAVYCTEREDLFVFRSPEMGYGQGEGSCVHANGEPGPVAYYAIPRAVMETMEE